MSNNTFLGYALEGAGEEENGGGEQTVVYNSICSELL